MKLKSIMGLAIAAVASTAALALPPAQWQPGRAPVLNVYYGGATATDNVLENLFLIPGTGICQPGTIDIYRVTVSNRNNRVIFCSARAGIAGIAVNTPIAFHKESIGGSSNGTVPLARQQPLAFFNMGVAGTCTNQGLQTPGGLNSYTQWSCPDNTVSFVPDGGITDTEANLSSPRLSASEIATLQQTRGLGIVFGVPVSRNLYRALQAAQGLAQDDSPTNVPSLTRSQIRGLYQGSLTDWAQITNAAGVGLPSVSGVSAPRNAARAGNPIDSSVFVCRRVASSGTQASYESYWLQQRCGASSSSTSPPPFSTPDDGSTDTVGRPANANWDGSGPGAVGGFVNGSESSGDVRNCFSYHVTNGTWAIGTLSTEVSLSNIGGGGVGNGGFRMIRVDGALPNLASVANGDYDFFTENVTTRRIVAPTPPASVLPLLNFIGTNLGSPAVLSLINVPFQGRSWGDGGVLAIPFGTNVPNAPPAIDGAAGAGTMRANPVNTQSRSTVNDTVNNCNPPIMVNPSPVP
jgi:hypothetical protein